MENFPDLWCFSNLEMKKDHTTKMTILISVLYSEWDWWFYSLLMQFLLNLLDNSTVPKWDAHYFRFPMHLWGRQAEVWVTHAYEYILAFSMGYIIFLQTCCFSLDCIFHKGSSQLFLPWPKLLSFLLPSHWVENHRHRLVCAKSQ